MNNPTLRDGLRLGVTLWAAIIALSAVVTLVSSSLVTLLSGSAPSPSPSDGGIAYRSTIATSLLLLAPVVLSRWSFYGEGYGASLPRPPVVPRFIAGVMLTWFAMGATGVANLWLRVLVGQDQFSGLGISDKTMVFVALNAGVTEEAAYLAAPSGLLFLALSLVSQWKKRRGQAPLSPRSMWLSAAMIGPALVLVGRVSGHLYQGPVSAIMGAAWGAALIATFVWARSVWPVILGHIIYDLPVHYSSSYGLISYHVIAPAVMAGICLIWLRVTQERTRRGESLLRSVESS